MSQKILQDINNIVDREKSEYYYYNKRKRHFWHSKSVTLSCRVRDKNDFNKAPDMAINIRAFLLNYDKKFLKNVDTIMRALNKKDMDQLKNYVISRFGYNESGRKVSNFEEIEKKVGLIIMSLPEEDVRGALNLQHVVTCRLLGYEKEFFYLKCYYLKIWPSFILRTLYHTNYSHNDFENRLDEYATDEQLENNPYNQIDYNENGLNDPYKGLEIAYYLDRIKFF